MSPARGWLAERMAEARIAMMTLSRLPAGRAADPAPEMAAASWAFPLVGALIGSIAAAAYAVATAAGLPPVFSALIAVTAGIMATGAIHEDGLADLADGLGGGQSRKRKLEIMRDSHIGVYGVLALLLALAMRVVCITTIAAPMAVAWALIAIAITSRTAIVVALYAMPPARADGLGQSASNVTLVSCAIASTIGIAALALITDAWLALTITLAIAATGAALAWLAWRQIGGQTGDVLGAIQQCTEIAGLAAVVAYIG